MAQSCEPATWTVSKQLQFDVLQSLVAQRLPDG